MTYVDTLGILPPLKRIGTLEWSKERHFVQLTDAEGYGPRGTGEVEPLAPYIFELEYFDKRFSKTA